MEFPLYAKHKDNSVYYEILSSRVFNEKKRLGSSKDPLPDTFIVSQITSEDYSTSLYIQDLIDSILQDELIQISASEYEMAGNPNL
jgi:hypothetical protein